MLILLIYGNGEWCTTCYIWNVVKTFGNLWVYIGYCGISLRGAIASIAEQVVVGALDGYNGTIFAYGQTGSGKTYTITGGAERYVDRGIIPRAISLVFSEVADRSEYTYTIHFSYLEVYNEMGYDLLNPDHETKALEDLPKVLLSFRYLEFNNIVIIFKLVSIDNRVIRKVTLSSPCLWASFHPISPLSVVSAK